RLQRAHRAAGRRQRRTAIAQDRRRAAHSSRRAGRLARLRPLESCFTSRRSRSIPSHLIGKGAQTMKLWRTKEIFKLCGFNKVKRAIKSGELRSRMSKGVIYVEHAWLVEWLGCDPLLDPTAALPEDRAPGRLRVFKDRTGQRFG